MGNWALEIAKMAIYITFPVGLFHYFNQPEYFEDYVVQKKRELCAPETEATRKFEKALAELKRKQNLALAEELENK